MLHGDPWAAGQAGGIGNGMQAGIATVAYRIRVSIPGWRQFLFVDSSARMKLRKRWFGNEIERGEWI